MAEPTGGNNPTQTQQTQVEVQSQLNELILQSSERQETLNKYRKERLDLMNQELDTLKEQMKTEDSILRAAQGKIPNLKKIQELQAKINDENMESTKMFLALQEAVREELGETLSEAEILVKTRERMTEKLQKELDLEKDRRDVMIQTLKEGGKLERLSKIKVKDNQTLLDLLNDQGATQSDINDGMEKLLAYNDELEDLSNKLEGHSSKMARNFGLSSKFSETGLGTITDTVKQMQQMSDAGFDTNEILSKAFGQSFNMLNVFASLVDVLKDMVIQLDSVGKKLGATTGMGNVFQSQIMATFDATVTGGGTMEEASAAIGSLASGFSKFNPKAEDANEILATTVVRLGKIGISGDQAVKTMDFFTRTMRMSEEQSANLTVELAQLGQQMGMTATQIISDFQAVSADLAIYGQEAIDVFKDLEAQAKATGMQISSLVNLAKGFDQFDKAADQAAQLNAVLGTQLSSLELMNMTYDERVNYLRQEVSFAVGNMEGMDQYTQQFVAQALGMSSVAEAQKFLNMSQAEYLKYQGDMEAANKRQEDLANLTRQLVPVMDQLKIAFMNLATKLSPLIVVLSVVFDALSAMLEPVFLLLEGLRGWPMTLVLVVGGIAALVTGLILLNYNMHILQNRMAVVSAILLVGGLIMKHTEGPVRALAMGVTALALSMFLLKGQSMWLHGFFFVLASILGMRINPLLVNVFSFMAGGVIALAIAMLALQGPGQLTIALIMGMFLAMSLFVYMFTDFVDTLANSGEGLMNAAAGLYAIAGGLTAIGAAMVLLGPAGMLGIHMLASDLSKMGEGLRNTATGLEKISEMSATLSKLGDNGMIAISSEGNKINAIMGAGDVFQNFQAGKVTVDVNLPEAKTPNINLTVEMAGQVIETLIKKVVGGAG